MYKELSIEEFLNKLKSEAPTPGGGGVASLVAANGVALIMMVANLTVNNDKYKEWHVICDAILKESQEMLDELKECIDNDADAFAKVLEAYKTKDAEKIAKAVKKAAEVQETVIKNSNRALELCEALKEHSNPNLETDLKVSEQCLKAAIASGMALIS